MYSYSTSVAVNTGENNIRKIVMTGYKESFNKET